MKTKLTLAALLASASLTLAGPPITPAKIKRPLHISQVTSIFRPSEPTAPVQHASTGGANTAVAPRSTSTSTTTTTVAPIESPVVVSRKVHLNTFLNHPVSAPGPK